jgi:hypothetical protein
MAIGIIMEFGLSIFSPTLQTNGAIASYSEVQVKTLPNDFVKEEYY